MRTPKVSHEDFVVAWVTSNTIEDVMSATDMTKAAIAGRAQMLRKAGVSLPRMNRTSNMMTPLRVAQLNSLIKKHKR